MAALPRWRELNHFDKVVDIHFADATKFEDILKVGSMSISYQKKANVCILDTTLCSTQYLRMVQAERSLPTFTMHTILRHS